MARRLGDGEAAVQVTAAGWGALALAAAAAVLARTLGWAGAGAVAAGLGAVLAVSALGLLGRPRYAVVVHLAEDHVRAGQRAVGALRVTSTASRRLRARRLQLTVGRRTAELRVPSLPAGGAWEELLVVPTGRRGVVVLGPVRSVRGETLGLLRRTVRWAEAAELVVQPRTVPLTGTAAGLLRDLEGLASRELTEGQQSFHALREYVPGDDRRTVHWRTSAHRGTLMVRQDEDVRRTRTALVLADGPGDWADDAERETGISVLASLGVQALAEGRDLTVLAGDGRLPAATPRALLDGCARLPDAAGTPLAGVGLRAAREAPGASLVVLVTGSTATAAQLRAAARAVPAGTRAVVVACGGTGRPGVRADARVVVATVPDLDGLPRVVLRGLA